MTTDFGNLNLYNMGHAFSRFEHFISLVHLFSFKSGLRFSLLGLVGVLALRHDMV